MEYSRFVRNESIYYFCETDYIFKTEQWKHIPGYEGAYEGAYEVSDLGRVRSLSRLQNIKSGFKRMNKEFILKSTFCRNRAKVSLSLNGLAKNREIHVLVAMAFLNHVRCGYKIVIDHINNNSSDNRLINLQRTTSRINSSKDRKGGTSKYVGVSWHKQNKKWYATIMANGKYETIGSFKIELDAHNAYQKRLKEVLHEESISVLEG